MGKLNEIAQKAYECAVRRGKIDPDNDSNNNLHRDLLEEVAEVFECTGEKSPHIKEYLDVEEELADVIIVAVSIRPISMSFQSLAVSFSYFNSSLFAIVFFIGFSS